MYNATVVCVDRSSEWVGWRDQKRTRAHTYIHIRQAVVGFESRCSYCVRSTNDIIRCTTQRKTHKLNEFCHVSNGGWCDRIWRKRKNNPARCLALLVRLLAVSTVQEYISPIAAEPLPAATALPSAIVPVSCSTKKFSFEWPSGAANASSSPLPPLPPPQTIDNDVTHSFLNAVCRCHFTCIVSVMLSKLPMNGWRKSDRKKRIPQEIYSRGAVYFKWHSNNLNVCHFGVNVNGTRTTCVREHYAVFYAI